MPRTQVPRVVDRAAPHTVQCRNCGASVRVSEASDNATCNNCAVSWNWREPALIRGQR